MPRDRVRAGLHAHGAVDTARGYCGYCGYYRYRRCRSLLWDLRLRRRPSDRRPAPARLHRCRLRRSARVCQSPKHFGNQNRRHAGAAPGDLFRGQELLGRAPAGARARPGGAPEPGPDLPRGTLPSGDDCRRPRPASRHREPEHWTPDWPRGLVRDRLAQFQRRGPLRPRHRARICARPAGAGLSSTSSIPPCCSWRWPKARPNSSASRSPATSRTRSSEHRPRATNRKSRRRSSPTRIRPICPTGSRTAPGKNPATLATGWDIAS